MRIAILALCFLSVHFSAPVATGGMIVQFAGNGSPYLIDDLDLSGVASFSGTYDIVFRYGSFDDVYGAAPTPDVASLSDAVALTERVAAILDAQVPVPPFVTNGDNLPSNGLQTSDRFAMPYDVTAPEGVLLQRVYREEMRDTPVGVIVVGSWQTQELRAFVPSTESGDWMFAKVEANDFYSRAQVPEPSTIALFGLGQVGIVTVAGLRKRRQTTLNLRRVMAVAN